MERTILQIEQQLDNIIETTDTGLENQSFFNAQKLPDIKQSILPAKFIMQRMLRVE
jgi:hypothetical protein